jgi:hypothetical protein
MSDWHPDFDRFEADLNDRDAQTSPQKIRIYFDATTVWSSDGHSKFLANLLLAREWFTENNPDGVPFDYEILD